MSVIIDGKKISAGIKAEIKEEVARAIAAGKRPPGIAVIIAGNDPASGVYVRNVSRGAAAAGMTCSVHELAEDVLEADLLALIGRLNTNAEVDAILLQVPLPKHIDERKALLAIDPGKDADGFHPYNAGLLFQGQGRFLPCTPAGVVEMIKRAGIEIKGKYCVVIGRSNIVGKPAAMLMLQEHATITVCHSRTQGLAEICARADILIAAIGKPKFVTEDMIKPGAAVIDVGIHTLPESGLCGDVDFAACEPKAGWISPVPGGVGSMTIAMLLTNCMKSYRKRRAQDESNGD